MSSGGARGVWGPMATVPSPGTAVHPPQSTAPLMPTPTHSAVPPLGRGLRSLDTERECSQYADSKVLPGPSSESDMNS